MAESNAESNVVKRWMSYAEACVHTGMSTRWLQEAKRSGRLRAYKPGGPGGLRVMFLVEDLDALLGRRKQAPSGDATPAMGARKCRPWTQTTTGEGGNARVMIPDQGHEAKWREEVLVEPGGSPSGCGRCAP